VRTGDADDKNDDKDDDDGNDTMIVRRERGLQRGRWRVIHTITVGWVTFVSLKGTG